VACTAHVRERTVTCAAPGASAAAHANIYGGQGVFVKLATTSVSWDSATRTFGGTVTVQNLLPYPLGVHEGVQADSGGVKVFFVSGPTATAGTGTVTVQNADGTGALTAAGQPFVKYAQTLAPQQVSDPRTWLFHLDPGVTAFAFAVYVFAAQQPSAFRIVAPRQNDSIPQDQMTVEVIGNAPPATTSIRAWLPNGRPPGVLEYAGNNRWTGQVSTIGVDPRVLQPLKVVAVAPADSLVQTVALYNQNHWPVLTLTAPVLGLVVRDTTAVRVAGTCDAAANATPCTVTARVGSGPSVSVTGPAFDFTVAVPQSSNLVVTATDAHGASDREERGLIVETSPLWHEVASAGSWIEAASPNFLFYSDSSADTGVRALRLRNLATATDAVIRADFARRSLGYARVTPTGVVFSIRGGLAGDSLMVYHDGVLGHVGMTNGYVRVNGGWMAWLSPDTTLYLRDVVAGSTTPIAAKAYSLDVAANGDVVFEQAMMVKRYCGGVVTTIGPGESPKTDGNLIVYTSPWSEKMVVHPSEIQYVYLYDGSGSTKLSAGYNSTPSSYVHGSYAVRNGWVFYNTLGPSGGWQLFSRAPDGTTRPVSTEGPPADFEIPYGMQEPHAVGDNGEVAFMESFASTIPTMIYAAPPYAVRTAVGSWRPLEFFGSTLYVRLGRSFFQILP
jgi:hypothetical protein